MGEVKTVSISDYKEKVEEKAKWIKEFEEGPQPLEGCTCGQHTDPNQFLTEKQVTKHYLKDRQRYVEGLKGKDPLKNHMKIIENLRSDAPLVKLNMATDLVTMTYIEDYFNRGMRFYEAYIEKDRVLTSKAETMAKELRIGYEVYKEHIVKMLINSYIIKKRRFISENSDFAWKKSELLRGEDSLDTSLNETKGYINLMEEHFRQADEELRTHKLSIVAENLDRQIGEKLNCNHLPSSEVSALGSQMRESVDMIKEILAYNRKRDFATIQERYDEVKDDCSLEHSTKMLIDLELRKREIEGSHYADETELTVNNSPQQLMETIGMEKCIGKLPTKELESLFEKFKDMDESYLD